MNPLNSIGPIGMNGPQALASPLSQPQLHPVTPAELKEISSLSNANGELATTGAPGSFSDLLGRMVAEVNAKQAQANADVQGVLTGQNVPLHQAMISVEEANVSFQLMVEVRNKLLESYQEVMRMQI